MENRQKKWIGLTGLVSFRCAPRIHTSYPWTLVGDNFFTISAGRRRPLSCGQASPSENSHQRTRTLYTSSLNDSTPSTTFRDILQGVKNKYKIVTNTYTSGVPTQQKQRGIFWWVCIHTQIMLDSNILAKTSPSWKTTPAGFRPEGKKFWFLFEMYWSLWHRHLG